MKKFWKRHRELILIVGIAVLLRFYNYANRWVLNQDQARDAVIGLFGLRNGLWPEIGPPSSAGPYNFGPWYYYLIMFWEKIVPTINGVWIGFGIMSVTSVIFYYLAGGWIAGLLAAVAIGAVQNSPDMLNTVLVAWAAALVWWSTKKMTDSNNWRWGILVGFGVGLAINFHYQALGLLAIPLVIFVCNKLNLKDGLAMAIGLVTSFIPLIIFDIQKNGVWIKSVIEYYTVGVKKFYVPVRWLTEIRDFWPQLFGSVTVGINWFGYIWLILGLIVLGVIIKKRKKINKFWWILALSFLIQIGLMRMYKGVRSKEYLIAFHGYIILFCSWIMAEWFKLNKYLGIIILSTVLILAGINNWKNIYEHQSQTKTILEIKKEIDERIKYPVMIEHFKESDMASMPLFYLYYLENRIDKNGVTISICDGNKYECPDKEAINKNNYRIYINKSFEWYRLTSENIYERLMVNYGK